METIFLKVEDKEIRISNPSKVLWPEKNITKLDYIKYLANISPYLLKYSKGRFLMMWCYPDGIQEKMIVRKALPSHAPDWIGQAVYKNKQWIVLDSLPTLVWLANLAALELHVTFDLYSHIDFPTELVFDLDPMDLDDFNHVLEVALRLKEVMDSLNLYSIVKTSGATGLQIYIPIDPRYSFEETRLVNEFIAAYIVEKIPHMVTLDRVVNRRGQKLYLDYVQHWRGKTLPTVYSVRARPAASVSTPVTWEEVKKGFSPEDFTIFNILDRINQTGDLFSPITDEKSQYMQTLDNILAFIKN